MGCARFGFSSGGVGGMNLLDAFTGDFMKLLADTLQVGFLCLCLAQYSEKLWRLRELRKV